MAVPPWLFSLVVRKLGGERPHEAPRFSFLGSCHRSPRAGSRDVTAQEGPARAFNSPCTRRGEVETDCGVWGWRGAQEALPRLSPELGTWLQTEVGCQLGSRRDGGAEGGDAGVATASVA